MKAVIGGGNVNLRICDAYISTGIPNYINPFNMKVTTLRSAARTCYLRTDLEKDGEQKQREEIIYCPWLTHIYMYMSFVLKHSEEKCELIKINKKFLILSIVL